MRLVNKFISIALILCCFCLLLTGCSPDLRSDSSDDDSAEEESSGESITVTGRNKGNEQTDGEAGETGEEEKPAVFSFITAQGETMDAFLQEDVPMNVYDWSHLQRDGDILSYEDDAYTSRWGVDVSSHDGTVDWDTLKKEGTSFAFVRIGYRGYGKAGTLCRDDNALANIEGAQAAGLDTGVYFFSQAVNEEEAREEADFVLEILDGRSLELPVVFDPESILDDEARTDTVTGEQFTENTVTFCDRIEEAGYETMVYCNMMWEAYELDLARLSGLDIWYADYEPEPQTPYHFTFWQYTEAGQVPGIGSTIDLNLQMIRKEE